MPKYNYPKRLPLLTFLRNAEAIRKNPIPFHKKSFQKYGDSFSVAIGFKKRVILTRDAELTRYILQKNHKNYNKSRIQTHTLSKYLGHGLLTSNGKFWLKQRRLIQPAFHKEKIQKLLGIIDDTIKEQVNTIEADTQKELLPIMGELAFQVVAKSLFHYSASPQTLKRFQIIIEKVQQFVVKEVRLPHKVWWFKLSGKVKKHLKLSEESRDILDEIIQKRKNSKDNYNDLLDMLLDARYEDTGEPMPNKQLIDEITILFIAGHETTANALTFTLFLLAQHPEYCEKIFKEIQEVESKTNDIFEQLKLLTYTKACIEESMRLYPPAWITDRENIEDDNIGEFHIRKNSLIGISFYELHRNKKYWNKPDEFIPKRFLGDNKKETSGIYFPFGAGPRMCIGNNFAIYEMQLAVSQIVKKFKLQTSQKEVHLSPLITLKPLGLKVEFIKRQPEYFSLNSNYLTIK